MQRMTATQGGHRCIDRLRAGLTALAIVLAAGMVSVSGVSAQSSSSEGPIDVGILMPLSGAGGAFGERMLAAARLAQEEINEAGGPLGRKIDLVVENSETNPEQAVRAARKLVEVDDVVAILGTWASGVTLAVAPVAQNAGIIQMSTSGSSRITDLQEKGLVFRTEPDDVLFGKAYAEYALNRDWNEASVLGLNVPFTETTVRAFRERFEQRGGEVLEYTTYNEEQTTFRSEVFAALQPEPDFVHISGYEPDITAILKTAYQSGLKGRFLVPGFAVTDSLIADAGPAAEGLLLVEEGVAEQSAAYKNLSAALGGDRYYSFAAQAYDQVNLLALAIEAAGTTEGKAVDKALHDVSGPPGRKVSSFAEGAKLLRQGQEIDYQGASGPIDFNEDGNIATANFRISEVRNGETVPIDFLEGVSL